MLHILNGVSLAVCPVVFVKMLCSAQMTDDSALHLIGIMLLGPLMADEIQSYSYMDAEMAERWE